MRALAVPLALAVATPLLLGQAPPPRPRVDQFEVVEPALPAEGEAPPQTATLETDRHQRMTVDVRIAGAGPYRFLVDTGAERTVISNELASQLALQPGRAVMIHGLSNAKVATTAIIPELEINERKLRSIEAPLLRAINIGADGMIGVDSLRSRRVEFDFVRGEMSIVPANRPRDPSEGDEETIVIEAKRLKGRLISTEARIGGRRVTVVFDTGSEASIANRALRKQLLDLGPTGRPIEIHSVTGQRMTGEAGVIRELKIGSLGLTNLAVAFADAYIFRQLGLNDRPTLILGMNAIRAFDYVAIDFASRELRFTLPKTGALEPVRLAEARPLAGR